MSCFLHNGALSVRGGLIMGKFDKGKSDRRATYHEKMTKLGFIKIHPYVHFEDKAKLLKIIEEYREERLKKLD